jgi:hypothetical protein
MTLVRLYERGGWPAALTGRRGRVAACVLCALFCVFLVPTRSYVSLIPRQSGEAQYLAENAALHAVSAEEKVYLITEHRDGYEFLKLQYSFYPLHSNDGAWSIGTPKDASDIWTLPITAAQWADILRQEHYDYVYLSNIDEVFTELFSGLFANAPREKALYRVEVSGDAVLLVEMPA